MRKSLSSTLSARGNGSRRRPLFFEPLENRLLLDVALADDLFEAPQNSGAQFLDVLDNDIFPPDYSGRQEITSVSYGSEGGWIEIGEDSRRISYTPPADFTGTESFVYFVDGQFSATAMVTIFSPVRADEYQFPPDGNAKFLDVLANDPFWASYDGPREITAISETLLWGELEIGPDGKSLIYTPSTDVYGKDAFLYIVDEIYPAEVKIDILNPLKSDHYPDIVQRSGSKVLDVLANDVFWPGYGGERVITHLVQPNSGGTVTIAGGGKSLLYTPQPEFAGSDRFRYVVDGVYESSVLLQVHRPVQDDSFEIDTNTVHYTWMVTRNDVYSFSVDGHRITRDVIDRVTSVVGQTEHGGTVTITPGGQGIVYSAPAGFEGTDTFEYVADHEHPATVTVSVTRPVRNDYISDHVYEDTVGNRVNVLGNDFKGNGYEGLKTITSVSETAEGGVVTVAAGGSSLWYTPPGDYRGNDTFSYTVDGELAAEVTVYVGSIIVGDSYRFEPYPPRSVYSLSVLENDHFGWNYPGPGLITAVSETENGGSVTIAESSRSLVFLPPEGGSDRFTYTVDNKYEATVSVRFRNYLSADSFVVDQNSLAAELDPLANDFRYGDGRYYGGPRRITSVGPTEQGGTVTIGADRKTVSYEPAADFLGTDRFTYTVDGVMQRTITVQVIRRVRDDVFRVEPDSLENTLTVLVNDLFGADYTGAGIVTAVTGTKTGATVTVSEDGRSIIYTSAAGFSGEDQFTYTVDAHLKAAVSVWVAASVDEILPHFESDEEFRQWVLDDAVQRYEYLFGTPVSPIGPFYPRDWLHTLDGGVSPNAESAGSSRMHSETNVQVAGVDEADIIETDGSSLFILSGSELIIAKAWPAEDMKISSRVTIEGEPVGEYLQGDRLTVISKTWDDVWFPPRVPFDEGFTTGLVADMWWPMPRNSDTWVTVFDVSNPEAPKVIEKTKLDGTYVESRRIDDTVFLVLRDEGIYDWLPRPELIEVDDSFVYETREQYIDRMMAEMGEFLPQYTSYGADGEILEAGTLHTGENLSRPSGEDIGRLVSVVSMDISDNELGIVASTGIFTTGASEIYGSLDNLYIFDQQYTWEDGAVTDILKFDWDAETANVEFAAKGQVPGRMLNQFSADEYDGHLRIATTISNSRSGNWTGRDENVLFVLRDDGGVLEFVGSMQNLALEETIRSVRFMGDRAFVTTFRDIDPLFALDLSDPANPRARGHVILPGFNSYMQLIDEDHLLTVGRNTPAGRAGPTQVSLFDIVDITRPRLIDQYTFERFSTSEAETEHHAFGWYVEHGVLAMPAARVYWERVDQDGDGYRETSQRIREDQLVLFDVDVTATRQSGDGITLRGEVEHDSRVRRSAFIEDVLYSVAETSVWAVSIEDPSIQYAEIRWEQEPEPGPGPIIPFNGGEVDRRIQTIDDYGAGFRTDGQWGSRDDQGFAGGVHYGQAGSGQDVATWTFAVEPGRYQVAVTWPDYANRATNSPFTVHDGSTPLATVRVDQESAPDDFVEDRIGWETLGAFAILGDRLVVTLSDDADEYVIADAVRIERLEDQPGDANFDGSVDISDFNVWNQHKFSNDTDFSRGDFNGDGATDLSDFNIWNAHKFSAAPSPAPVDAVLANAGQQGSDAPLRFFGELIWLQELEQGGDAEQSPENGRPSETHVDKLLSTYWR